MVNNKNFYISLCVCILAIGAAGYSTYKSIKDFSSSDKRHNSTIRTSKKMNKIPEIKNMDKSPSIMENISNDKKISISNSKKKDSTNIRPSYEQTKEVGARVFPNEFIVPVKYSNVSEFNDDLEYSEEFQDWRTDDGINFTGEQGSDVCSISNGKISKIFDDPIYGKSVTIIHENPKIVSTYSRLNPDNIKFKENEMISQGQIISTIKDDKLHFSIQIDGKFINPAEFIGIS